MPGKISNNLVRSLSIWPYADPTAKSSHLTLLLSDLNNRGDEDSPDLAIWIRDSAQSRSSAI